jgi:hypothetical protein
MLGLISLGPQGDAEAQERRAELVPGRTGEVLGAALTEGFQESVGPRFARVVERGFTDQGDGTYAPYSRGQAADDMAAFSPSLPGQLMAAFRRAFPGEQPLPASPMVPLDVLKREYEIPGVLSFDKDTPQSVAQSLYDHKRAQMVRQDAIRRADNLLTQGMAARFAASMVGSLADPVNIAAMFVPGLNEAAVARMAGVAAGAGAAARAGVRAGAGASQGAAGQIALEPLNYLLMGQERDDWTMAGALANVLFGTVAGAGFHSGLGALGERVRGLPDWAPARAVNERIQNAPPEVQQALARSAVAATVEGRPVDVAPLLDLYTVLERERDALRGEIAALPANGLDEVTVGRLQAIDAELEGRGVTAKRRAELEAEKAMVLEGVDQAVLDLEMARTEAQRQGLGAELGRVEERLAGVESRLDAATRPDDAPASREALATEPTTEAGVQRAEAVARGLDELAEILDRPWTPEADNARLRVERDLRDSAGKDGGLQPAQMAALRQRVEDWRQGALAAPTARQALDAATASRVNPADAEPPAPLTRTGAAPPDPRPPDEPGAVAKDIAEIERQTSELDALIKMQGDERLDARIKEFDALVDEEVKVDRALFEAAAACIVRTA